MCYSQNDSLNLKNNIMKRFDSNNFKDLPLKKGISQTDNDRCYRTDKEEIRVTSSKQNIHVSKRKTDSLSYSSHELYYPETKTLFREGKHFSRMPIGIWKEYDKNGKLIKETDWDSNWKEYDKNGELIKEIWDSNNKFSVDSLIVKMKKEYGIDILNVYNELAVHRYIIDNKRFCEVYDGSSGGCFLFDVNTGTLLFRTVSFGDEGLGDTLYNLYIESLNKQK